MADAIAERRPSARFFCHRCSIEFEDVLQDYICPYCASGFIEQLESEAESSALSGDDVSDADMSNLDDSDEMLQSAHPVFNNDLALFLSGGRSRGGAAARPDSLLEQLVWTIGGGAVTGGMVAGGPIVGGVGSGGVIGRMIAGEPIVGGAGGGTVTGRMVVGGAPFVLVGAPGDYVFGGEGLDAVVTQLLGQLENAGPPPLPRDQIEAIPEENATETQADTVCSVCWDKFTLGETISRLKCEHIFHPACINPWLQLHATCPVCRRSLLPGAAAAATAAAAQPPPAQQATPPPPPAQPGPAAAAAATTAATASDDTEDTSSDNSGSNTSSSSNAPRRVSSMVRRLWSQLGGAWAPPPAPPSGSWAPPPAPPSGSDTDRDSQYNMDLDFD